MSVIKGENAILYFKANGYYRPVACVESWSLTTSTELSETSTTQTGTSRTYRGNRNTFTISCDGVCSFDTNHSVPVMRSLQQSFTVIPISIVETDDNGNGATFTGSVIITSIANNASASDFDEYTLEATGTGDWVYTEMPVDPNEDCQDAWYYYTGRGNEGSVLVIDALKGKSIAGRIYRDGLEYRPSGIDNDGTGTPVDKQFKFEAAIGRISFDTNLIGISLGEQIDIPYNTCGSVIPVCLIVIQSVGVSIVAVTGETDSTLEVADTGNIDSKTAYFTLTGTPAEDDEVTVVFTLNQLPVDPPYFSLFQQSNPDSATYKALFTGNCTIFHKLAVNGIFDGTPFNINTTGYATDDGLIDDIIDKLNDAGVTAVRHDEAPYKGFEITGSSSVAASSVVSVVGLSINEHTVTVTAGAGDTLADLLDDLLAQIQLQNPAAVAYNDGTNDGIKLIGYSTSLINDVTISHGESTSDHFQLTFNPVVDGVTTVPDDIRVRYSDDGGTTWHDADITYDPENDFNHVIINDNLTTNKSHTFEVTPLCDGTSGTPGIGNFYACMPPQWAGGTAPVLPDAYVGQPYNAIYNIGGSAPFNLASIVKPSWMSIHITNTFGVYRVAFTGTPTTAGSDITVSFSIINYCSEESLDFSDTIDVIQQVENGNATIYNNIESGTEVSDILFASEGVSIPYSNIPTPYGQSGTATIPLEITGKIVTRFNRIPTRGFTYMILINGSSRESGFISSPSSIVATSINDYTIHSGDVIEIRVF